MIEDTFEYVNSGHLANPRNQITLGSKELPIRSKGFKPAYLDSTDELVVVNKVMKRGAEILSQKHSQPATRGRSGSEYS